MEKRKKIDRKQLHKTFVCISLVVVIWIGYIFAYKKIEQGKERQIRLLQDDFSWIYQVESIEKNEKDFLIEGFAFQINKNSYVGDFEIALNELETGINFFMEMDYSDRTDVNEFFGGNIDYIHSGFVARIKTKKLDLQNKDYEVILRVTGEERAYRTGMFISKGELIYVDPKKYVPLEVEGTDLANVIEKGVLKLYQSEYGMYVYQWENQIFWIASPEYDFLDGETRVQYQYDTIQIVEAQQNSLDVQPYAKNSSFWFSENEVLEWNTGKYRVAKGMLPVGVPIRRIWTGNYDEEWIWMEFFRPDYRLR